MTHGLRPLHNPGAPVALRFGELELLAFSISGVSSYVIAPAFDACFDLGHCAVEAARLGNVWLTHVHQDHALGVFRHHSLRMMFGASPARVFVPVESVDALRDTFVSLARLEQRSVDEPLPEIIGVRAGDEIRVSSKQSVRVFDVIHRIASRGYTVIETRRTLRAEYRNATREERGAARARGEHVSDAVQVAAFTYIGDSTIETLTREPHVGQSEVLFLEATHIRPTPRETSAKWGHTHLDEIVELMERQPEMFAARHIVLKHFSTRYRRSEIRAAMARIPSTIRERVTVLI